MKKYLALLLLSVISLSAFAVDATFMGIPIDGPIRAFEKKLVAKGFKLEDPDPDGDLYSGIFTGKMCDVTVMGNSAGDVYLVGAYLPSNNTWSAALKEFNEYVDMYTRKYGDPSIETTDFGGYTPGTAAFVNALNNGDVQMRTIFIVDDIFISISLQPLVTVSTGNYQLLILYQNDNNYEEDYSDDI